MVDQQNPGEDGGPVAESKAQEMPREQNYHDMMQEGEDADEDPQHYTGSIATALADQRISRKKASEDVKILANRIALLKAEEQKAWKKIEETKKKAQDILEVRQRNQVKNTDKAMSQAMKNKAEQMQFQINQERKQQRQNNIAANTQAVHRQAQEEAFRLKREREQHEKMVLLQKDTETMHNMQMKQMIRAQKADSVAMREQDKAKKKQAQRMELITRIEAENARRQEIERQVAQLEGEEAEWIKKLQHTNQLQSVACSEYEVALTNDPEQLQQMSVQKKTPGKR